MLRFGKTHAAMYSYNELVLTLTHIVLISAIKFDNPLFQRGGFRDFFPEPSDFYDNYQFRPQFRHRDYRGFGYSHGDEYFDNNYYKQGNRKLNDGNYGKGIDERRERVNHEEEGYQKGKAINKNSKGSSGYYTEEDGEKKLADDKKYYEGSQHFNKKGENEGENKQKDSHKKGHKIKGFKTTHHKDENGKTEEFYDEEHDEGGKYNYGGQSGSFGENKKAGFKGEHDKGEFVTEQKKKEGHYAGEHAHDNSNANKGEYEEKKFSGNQEAHGFHKDADEQALHKHQESNGVFKHDPYRAPFRK